MQAISMSVVPSGFPTPAPVVRQAPAGGAVMPHRMIYRIQAVHEHADSTLITVGKVSTIVGGGTAFIGGLSASDLAAFAGIAGMAVGLLIQ